MSAGLVVPPGLRRALADRSIVPRPNGPEAWSSAMLRAHVLAKMSRLLTDAGLEVLLVKGAALALTVYAEPAARMMSDIDVLVRPGESDRVVAALVAGGCDVRPEPGRLHSAPLMGEVGVFVRAGAMAQLVEVHTTLDKVVPRPIDIGALVDRATPAPSLPSLRIPLAEDHALLVALHAASHDFTHAVAFLDLELLLRQGLDLPTLVARAEAFRLKGVMFAMLSAMRQLGAASVDDALVAAFDPGPLRRVILTRAGVRGASRPGLGWIAAQTPLRDDPLRWIGGVGRYAVARVRDRSERDSLTPAPARVPTPETTSAAYRIPRWVRAFMALDQAAARLEHVRASVRDEALLAWVPPDERVALTASMYARHAQYLPGGARFDSGLFSWEARVLASPAFPRTGRVLIGAAGAGRELVALVERGYEVVAFDPCEPFADAAGTVATKDKAISLRASYADLIAMANGEQGPLADAIVGKHFDAVILGWGSLSHVMPSSARVDLFRALRKLAPTAPVLTSFGLEGDPAALSAAGPGRLRNALRRMFSAMGAPGVAEDRDHFLSTIGFFSYLSHEELRTIAAESGYEIGLFEETPYAYALLTPARSPLLSPP